MKSYYLRRVYLNPRSVYVFQLASDQSFTNIVEETEMWTDKIVSNVEKDAKLYIVPQEGSAEPILLERGK